MPQDTYTLIIDSTRSIEIETRVLPPGFDTLDALQQDLAARQLVQQQLINIQQEQQPVSFKEAATILGGLLGFALVILFIARLISARSNKKEA